MDNATCILPRLFSGLILALVLCSDPARADTDQLRRDYVSLRDNSDLYVGEASAWLKDEGNDGNQASAVAEARARAALAEAIEVRVQSRVEDTQESGPKGTNETLRSEASASSDLKLENVHIRSFADFPKPGEITALAWISKEDYRRQRAGKGVAVYRPENGIRLYGGLWEWSSFLGPLQQEEMSEYGFDLVWRHFVVGGGHVTEKNSASSQGTPEGVLLDTVHLGYEWTPFSWRVQPFLPLGFEYGNLQMSPKAVNGGLYAFTVAAGLRYWANDSVALEFEANFPLPLNAIAVGEVPTGQGDNAQASLPDAKLSAPEYRVQLLWSAF